jgi:hypothetical protein
MTDDIRRTVFAAIRTARADALGTAIELCNAVHDNGGCAKCCANEITKLRDEMMARDLTNDALEKAAKGQ